MNTQKRRPKGEGSIIKLPNGNYKATITIGKGIDGRQKRKSITRRTRAEVLEAITNLRVEYGIGKEDIQPDKRLQEVITEFMSFKEQEITETSYMNYRSHMTALLQVFGNIFIKDITPIMMEQYFRNVLKTQKPSSVLRKKTIVSMLFKYAVKKKYMSINPVKGAVIPIKKTPPKAALMTLPTPEEFKRLLIEADKISHLLFVMVYFDSVTGLRKGELLGLKWSMVDADTKTITINNQKDRFGADVPLKTQASYRTIHVSDKALAYLTDLDTHDTGYVFPLSRYEFDRTVKKLLKVAKMPKGFTFHDIRHYHATQLLKHGVNAKVVSRRLGHTSIVTTLNIYFNYLPSMDEEASKVLDDDF